MDSALPDPPSDDKLVLFTGVFDYLPNEQGALWFLEEIWPLVLQRHADASFATGRCADPLHASSVLRPARREPR